VNRLLRLLGSALAVLLAVPALLLSATPPAAACSCELVDPEAAAAWGEQVFTATIVEDVPAGAEGTVALDAVVTHVYRGDPPERVTVWAHAGETSCGPGTGGRGEARLYESSGQDARQGDVFVGTCGGSPLVSDAVLAEVEADLGPGVARDVPPGLVDPPVQDRTLVVAGVLGGLASLLAALVAVAVVLRRQPTSGRATG
jgi:hypothetical protein